jgi:hypothetical protein
MRIALFAATAVAAIALAGCGKDVPRGRVHGTIKYQGKPLTDATLILIASDNQTHSAHLTKDGTFEVTGVAYGQVKVSVQPLLPRSFVKADPVPGKAAANKNVVDEKASFTAPEQPKTGSARLPAHYTDAEKSGLSFELKEPDQEWSVDLK